MRRHMPEARSRAVCLDICLSGAGPCNYARQIRGPENAHEKSFALCDGNPDRGRCERVRAADGENRAKTGFNFRKGFFYIIRTTLYQPARTSGKPAVQ